MTLRKLHTKVTINCYIDSFSQEIIAQTLGRAMATTTFKELTRI